MGFGICCTQRQHLADVLVLREQVIQDT